MAENLTNKHIYETYRGLIKTGDNLPIDDTLKVLSDGDGNELPIEVSTDEVKFKEGSSVDFTDVTIIGGEGFQGPQGAQGAQGINGVDGAQGATGAQGPQGTNGVDGAQGAQGAQGTNGINGAQGFQGVQGPQGVQGINGVNGAQGAQGAQGINGVNGAQGAQGPQGFQGALSGVAINDTTPNTSHTGNLNETIIDTLLIPANSVKDGDIFNYLTRISGTKVVSATTTVRLYLNTSATIGGQTLTSVGVIISTTNFQSFLNRYFYVNKADGTGLGTQLWNANASTELVQSPINYTQAPIDWTVDQYIVLTGQLTNALNSVNCQGSTFANQGGGQGVQGPQGPANGPQGSQGAQGPQGFQGVQGPQGFNGSPGAPGIPGNTGAQGAQGPQGFQGTQGFQGVQGPQGFQGQSGISAGANYYFNQSQDSDVSGYKVLSNVPTSNTQQTVTTNLAGSQQNALVQQFITPELGFTVIPAGVQRFNLYYTLPAANAEVDAYVTLELADENGTGYGQIIASGPVEIQYNAGLPVETQIDVILSSFAVNATDRMIVKLYLNNQDSTTRSVVFSTENGYYSYVVTTVGVVGNQGPQGFQGVQGPEGTQGVEGAQGATGAQGAEGAQGTTGAQGVQGPQGFQGTQGPTNPDNITSSGPNTIANVWSGTQAQYNALGTYSATTLYFIE